ncbi:MAG: N-glycosylase/DNA lyase [Candidatus Omnitrophota bacterium]
MPSLKQLKKTYRLKKPEIISRLNEFKRLGLKGSDKDIFTELCFCILTPQSKAKLCWDAICALKKNGWLFKGCVRRIRKYLYAVRFKNKKAVYIVNARKLFKRCGKICIKQRLVKLKGACERREWLVKNIVGIGYKEASHFLRNTGDGEKIAILDRHILKNLNKFGVIKEIPSRVGRAKYLKIEKNMMRFAKKLNIPASHLDLLFWSQETGEVFK